MLFAIAELLVLLVATTVVSQVFFEEYIHEGRVHDYFFLTEA